MRFIGLENVDTRRIHEWLIDNSRLIIQELNNLSSIPSPPVRINRISNMVNPY